MATIVCQNLQSCLESQVIESRTLRRLKLSSPKPLLSSQSIELAIKSCFLPPKEPKLTKPETACGGWSSLQFPEKPDEIKEVYVHPLLKRPLSRHSLEMCTENLGSETGSDDGFFSIPSSSQSPRKQRQVPARTGPAGRTLPPPLTTISGSECVRIETRREGGRMLMEAVKGPSAQTCFRSERAHGRLRLYICSTSAPTLASQQTQDQGDVIECKTEGFENDPLHGNANLDRGTEEEEEERGVWSVTGGGEGISGNYLKVRGKTGNEALQIPSRCKEGCEKWEACRAVTTS